MTLGEIEDRIPALYLASCADGGAVPYFTGPIGMGKTSVIKLFPKLMKRVDPQGNYGLVVLNGATLNIATLGGFLQFGPDYKGKPTSKFSLPYWWFTKEGKALDEYDGGIIFIDEADKMPPDENKTVGEASLSKVWFTHWLPSGWVVWFAGNRMSDRAGSMKRFDHLINRQREIPVRTDTETWVIRFAEPAGLLPEVITFGRDNPTLLFQEKPDIQGPWCTPRSLHQADIHLRALMETFGSDKIPTDPLTEEELAGGIGGPAAAGLIKTIREGQELPSYVSVIADPMRAIVPSKPDLMRLMAYKMADALKNSDIKKALAYISRYPTEFQVIFARLAINKDFSRTFDDDMGAWCDKHAALIAVIQKYKMKGATT
jgi:hypothetical protein